MQRGRKSAASLEIIRAEPAGHQPRPAFDPPQPPDHLGEPEQRIWAGVFADYTLATGASIAVLATALEAHQRAREAREVVLVEGMLLRAVMVRQRCTRYWPLNVMRARRGWPASRRWG